MFLKKEKPKFEVRPLYSIREELELISIYYGSDIAEEDAKVIRDEVEKKYGSCDIELQYGGQPIYYYIVSAE